MASKKRKILLCFRSSLEMLDTNNTVIRFAKIPCKFVMATLLYSPSLVYLRTNEFATPWYQHLLLYITCQIIDMQLIILGSSYPLLMDSMQQWFPCILNQSEVTWLVTLIPLSAIISISDTQTKVKFVNNEKWRDNYK